MYLCMYVYTFVYTAQDEWCCEVMNVHTYTKNSNGSLQIL